MMRINLTKKDLINQIYMQKFYIEEEVAMRGLETIKKQMMIC